MSITQSAPLLESIEVSEDAWSECHNWRTRKKQRILLSGLCHDH
jgi:hypothetical protein